MDFQFEYQYKMKCPKCGAEWEVSYGLGKDFRNTVKSNCSNPECNEIVNNNFSSILDSKVTTLNTEDKQWQT